MSAGGNREKALISELLRRHGTLYSTEIDIDLSRNTPSPLFRWLCAAVLFSTRISAGNAARAARALAEAGWTTPEKMADSTWEERVQVLNTHGYARYDESTARMLADCTELLQTEYGGDLRGLREKARRDPAKERKRLKAFKGLGDVGVSIFCREIQLAWDEQYPFIDQKALAGARQLGLGDSGEALAGLVDKADFPRLVAALVRMELTKDRAEIEAAAAET